MRAIMILSSVVALVLGTTAWCQTVPASAQADQIAQARRRVVEPPARTRLPKAVDVAMLGSKTLPLVEVRLNGKGPYKLLVDSAANVTLLQTRVADELQLPVLRPGERSKLVALQSIQIGDARFDGLVVGARSWDEPIDGVIGFNVFADCLLTMDFVHERIRLRSGTLPPANGKDIFTYGLDNRSPTMPIRIAGQTLTLLIDTGAAQGIVITDAMAAKLQFVNGLAEGPKLSTFEAPASRARVGRPSGSVTLGIHEIVGPKVHVWNDDTPVIGCGLFRDFVLTFDQKSKTIKISA